MAAISSLEIVGRLVLSAFLGFVVGLERALAGQPAGERTHALASVGAGAFGLISVTGLPGSDPTRIAAGVVTGLGFLGAGMILKDSGQKVQGLTTAAGIWAVGSGGLAVGMGLYLVGIGSTMVVLLLLASERLTKIDDRIARSAKLRAQQSKRGAQDPLD